MDYKNLKLFYLILIQIPHKFSINLNGRKHSDQLIYIKYKSVTPNKFLLT